MSVSNGIPTVDEIGDEALTSSIIDRSITDIYDNIVTKIGYSAFHNCIALNAAKFPNVTAIGDTSDYYSTSAFSGCSALTTIDFPAATIIGKEAFRGCSALTTIDFPAATFIGSYVFYECSELTTVILRNTTKVITLKSVWSFNNTPIASGTGYIYVPKALVDSYKTATNWSTFANQIRAIEDYPLICDPLT